MAVIGNDPRMSVREAARAAGMSESRVRGLVRAGRVPASRVVGRLVIDDPAALFAPRRAHRPLSPRMAWALILWVDGERAPWVSPNEVVRLKKYASALAADPEPEALLAALLRARGARLLMHAPEPDRIRGDRAAVSSGVVAPEANMVAGNVWEGYVHGSDLDAFVARHLLVPAARGRANVWVHPAAFLPERAYGLQIAADLADHAGPREAEAARRIITDALGVA